MKRFLLFWIFILMVLAVFAQGQGGRNDANGQAQRELNTHVTAAQAMDVGYAFMHTGSGSKRGGTQSGVVSKQAMQLVYTGKTTDSLTRATTDCYYVFALQPKGFVIVAADERVNPILGYSYDNDFVVENMPEQVRGWLGGYEKQIKTAIDRDMEPVAETTTKWSRLKSGQPMSNTRNGNSVGPLLTTTWNQGQYYNNLCPADVNGPAGHVYTGCVATAMAQIINYHQYPQHGRGTHSYESNYGTLTVNYGSANYDYTNMPNALTYASNTTEVDAVATLMRDCGVAVNMGYAADESGSFDVEARVALINFFKYSPNMSFAEKAYFTNDEWETMLRNDLDAGNPVYYSGQGTGGHAFVCDGYNADGYFSFNFGWGGYCNGWYLTSNVNPGSSTFNDSQSAIFGITPDSTCNVILGHMYGASTFTVDEPLEFYHLMGHNAYEGGNYSNSCNSTVHFVPANSTNQIVADILDYEDQNLSIFDGDDNLLRGLYAGSNNDLSPVVSSQNALRVVYSGNLYYAGFKLNFSQTNSNECRMVSNITSHVDTTTVNLTWIENGGATQWEIEYGVKGFELGIGTVYTAFSNTVSISNLQELTEYDFYIRPVCGINQYGSWNKLSLMIDGHYWQDVVTSQPEGYVYDAATNSVQIFTAEQLTWWAKTGNGIDGHLAVDIDLSGYKWQPTALSNRNFNGHGHIITNMFVLQGNGLFSGNDAGSVIENLGMTKAYIKSYSSVGGLCGDLGGTMRNCYVSNSVIEGGYYAGGLVNLNSGIIENCYVNAEVIGSQAGLMTCNSNGIIRNCYAAGKLRLRSWCYNAGIAAVVQEGEISNCYSVDAGLGVVGLIIGTANLTNLSTFVKSGNDFLLSTPVIFDEITDGDLLSALNRGVTMYNDSVYCTWAADTENENGGYPIFGGKYTVYCPNISQVSAQNVTINNNHGIQLNWTENGNATQWRIRYRLHDRPDTAYSYVTTTSKPVTIFDLLLQSAYDFNVCAICDTNHQSGWSETLTMNIDLPFWTDIVSSQPAGYVEDVDGNVEIYSAEGLAWLSVKTNGLHNQQKSSFLGKTVTLKSDINLEGYRWFPIGNYFVMSESIAYGGRVEENGDTLWGFAGTFDGHNHTISNIYMNTNNEHASGLFGFVYKGKLKNVILNEGLIIGGGGGGLVDIAFDCYEINNCHSSVTLHSNGRVGDYYLSGYGGVLCGQIWNTNLSYGQYYLSYGQYYLSFQDVYYKTIVSNCSTSGTIYGGNSCGDLVGHVYGNVEIRNCYSTGNVNVATNFKFRYKNWRGGMVGLFIGDPGGMYNCFSTGSVEACNGKVIGGAAGAVDANSHIHYVYHQDNVIVGRNLIGSYCDDIADTSQFHHDDNTNVLSPPVTIEGTNYSNLLDALNAWVVSQNDSTLRMWVLDSITGYPVFGDYFMQSCSNPTDLTISQATVVGDTTVKTCLTWTSVGEPDHWEVQYVATGQLITSSNFSTIVSVNNNPCVLSGIPNGQPLDFYVRAVCDEDNHSGWCGPVTYIPDKLHWTEVVTSQPEGFQIDANGNVYISSAEGLSWLSSIVNGLNGARGQSISNIVLTKDIDLSAYRWTAIHGCNATFNGNNHVVMGLYCNELSNYQGLFGLMNGNVYNLILTQCNVKGSEYVGTIVGCSSSKIVNCAVNGDVSGYCQVGGLTGRSNSIENSCFIGNVATGRYITNATSHNGYSGGISGSSSNNTIVNCYVASDFADIENYFSGIISPSGSTSSNVSNCYYTVNEINLPIADGNMSSNSGFAGSNYTWMLNNPPYINGAFRTDLVDALNAWVDANNTNGQYNRWVADTNMVNGGYPVFESVSFPEVTTQDTVVVQGYYSWHGLVFTSNTVVIDTISTIFGYDSVVTHYVIVTPAPITEISIDTCGSYIWNGETYSKTGDYVQAFPTVSNYADSVVILHLTINRLNSVDVQHTCSNSYTWINGVTYLADNNTATYMLQTAEGCDSIVTLQLTIGHSNIGDTTAVACESFTWYGTTYTESGDYQLILTNASGCDSIVTLHLTVNHLTTGVDVQSACESFTWIDGNTYTENTQEPTFTITNATGCDSVVTLHLTINHSSTGDTTVIACDSFDWYEHSGITQSCENLTHTFTNAAGCDSIVTLHLTINNSSSGDTSVTACDSFTWYGTTYTESGNYTSYQTNIDGCDSIVTLHLIINNSTSGDTTAVAYYSFDWYEHTGITQSCENLTHTFTNAVGCDSVVTLHLTINHTTYGDTTAIACNSFDWYEHTGITQSCENLIHTFTNVAGYDSVVTLHLTVNHTTYGDTSVVAYNRFDWYEHTGIMQSCDNLTHTFTNAMGCDSIVTLHLTINVLYWTDVVTSQPEGYQEDENGNVYISSAEGLSWLSSVVNELNGAQYRQFNHVVLTHDIDLSAYRWKPIGNSVNYFRCTSFNGNNHIISGLHCHESTGGRHGLFGYVDEGDIHDLMLTQCEIYGNVAGAIASLSSVKIYNCLVNGNVRGIGSAIVGGLVGMNYNNLENSCFIGSTSGGCYGGICGYIHSSSAVNCYAVNDAALEGILTSTCLGNGHSSNCYYREFDTIIPSTGSGNTSNNSGFTGGGYTWMLSTPPYINGLYHTDLVDALNAWVDSNNIDGRYCHWVADTAMVNGGYPVFEAKSYPVIHDTVTAHESYNWHGMVFTSDTVLADTILTSTGYFNVLMHHLLVYHPVHTAITVDTCNGYFWEGTTYNTSGDYTYSHLDANSCMQVDTLHLTVRFSTTGDTTAIVCNSFNWYEHTGITQSCENLTHIFTNATGCDSIVTLHLTVNHSTHDFETVAACENYVWHGETYSSSGIYTFSYTNTTGCASTDTLRLTINQPTFGDTSAIVCDSFIWYDSTYTQSGDYISYQINTAGCDSIVTLHLTINHSTIGDTSAIACDSFIWYDSTYIASGDYTSYLTNIAGCDSIVTLHLTVNHSTHNFETMNACENYVWNGDTYFTSGIYTFSYTNTTGCASTDTLHLTINHPTFDDTTVTACESFTWIDSTYTQSGDYTSYHIDANGCDSVVTLHLTVNPSFSIEAYLTISENDLPFTYGDTTFMPGTVQSGDYIFNFTTADGCDSVIILHLTVETGINDYSLNASMKLYPNPTKDLVNVQLTMNNEQLEGVNIQVFDVYGRLLEVVNMADARGASLQTTQIDLSRYANGVYLIKAVAEGNVLAVRKVVKK